MGVSTAPTARRRLRLRVTGAVQGAGFRPFVYRAAGEDGLASLLIRQHSDRDDLFVRLRDIDGRAVLYWLDGPLIYALVSDGDEEELRAIVRAAAVDRDPEAARSASVHHIELAGRLAILEYERRVTADGGLVHLHEVAG